MTSLSYRLDLLHYYRIRIPKNQEPTKIPACVEKKIWRPKVQNKIPSHTGGLVKDELGRAGNSPLLNIESQSCIPNIHCKSRHSRPHSWHTELSCISTSLYRYVALSLNDGGQSNHFEP